MISLDFELMWGVRDTMGKDGGYRLQLNGVREVVPRMLDLFNEFRVAATWATVGALFAESLEEFSAFMPAELPTYTNPRLSPYSELVRLGVREADLNFAPSIVREIAARPSQELASHTFSHYYCLEPGQTHSQFEADTVSAVGIANAHGHVLTSMVFPRNQVNENYLPILRRHGFTAYRGTEGNLISRPQSRFAEAMALRGMRVADAIIPITGSGAFPWSSTAAKAGLSNVRASRFFRSAHRLPLMNELIEGRVERGMLVAARSGTLYHLWWHPHNFGKDLSENLAALRRILTTFERLRDRYGFEAYTMRQVASVWGSTVGPQGG